MWRAVTMTAVLGLGWCGDLPLGREDAPPQEVPGQPPQLPPLDAADDVFQPGFLSDPHAHFTFAARTDRRDARPQLLETTGNVVAYINRLSRPPHRTTNIAEVSTKSSAKRNRGTPPPSPPPDPMSFESIEENVRPQPKWLRPDLEAQPSIPTPVEGIKARQPEETPAEERQRAVASTPKSKIRFRGTIENSVNQPKRIRVEQEPAQAKIEEEVSTIRSRPTRPVRTTEPAQEYERTTAAAAPQVTRRRMPAKRKQMPLLEYERPSTAAPGAPRATKPPPPPVPTLSPWIDGYGK